MAWANEISRDLSHGRNVYSVLLDRGITELIRNIMIRFTFYSKVDTQMSETLDILM